MYRYETHVHTSPVSKCAKATVRETVEFYKAMGYDGIIITNHFLDGNIDIDPSVPYKEKLDFYYADADEAEKLGREIGLQVFCGEELSYGGTDFLIYGLDRRFYYEHPEVMEMDKRSELALLADNGAFISQAHPYREAFYIDHIRLYPRSVHAAETVNANRTELENRMADIYADAYGLLKTAGTDNHRAGGQAKLAGMECPYRLRSCADFVQAVKNGELRIFTLERPDDGWEELR